MKFPMIKERMSFFKGNFILFLILLFTVFAQAKEIPKPTNQLVNDFAEILTISERLALERKLIALDDSTSTQIAIVVEKSLEGDDIVSYGMRIADAWKIGQDGKDNGVLIYIAVEDRKLHIFTGYGVEATLTDLMAGRIVRNTLIPAMKRGAYYDGLDQSTTQITKITQGEFTAEDEEAGINPIFIFLFILLLFFLFAYLASKGNGGSGGGYYRGGEYNDPWAGRRSTWTIGGGGFSGGGSSGGFGGGGFGGFGGGGFGGGGAGGSW